ncbi:MAG: CinA family nicotinamide mononucleotide deamidase-related protein [Odoribacteraceae bacterium]|jgi:nicotinamide-nucleotide amidase|nr:CinA family nicotinamide mononucleotide deamidase-related protein [Odoribacteraceae bacterium]
MNVIIVTIGDEILLGQVLDTNAWCIARHLARAGMEVVEMLSIVDRGERIAAVLDDVLARAGVVIITGGLGPTNDDVTKRALADYFHAPLVLRADVLAWIEELLDRRGQALNENNRGQACLPEGCRVLFNPKGTAPGMWFERGEKVVIALPGVPFEMEHLMEHEVMPALRARYPGATLAYRVVKVYHVAESDLAHRLAAWEGCLPGEVGLAYLPSPGLVKLRVTARGEKGLEALDACFAGLLEELAGLRFTVGEEPGLGEEVLRRLRGKSLAVAESCTGGSIAREITRVPGASDCFAGGVVAYSNEVKATLLGVSWEVLARHGAVSEPVVVQMAEGVRRLLKTDYAVATSGIAGPGGAVPGKPVGTTWIAVATPRGTAARLFHFSFTRERNIARAVMKALEMVIEAAGDAPPY